jgi:hypothetical protein
MGLEHDWNEELLGGATTTTTTTTKKQQKTEISTCSIEEECKEFMINLSSFQQMLDRWKALEAKLLNPMTEELQNQNCCCFCCCCFCCLGRIALPNMCWSTPAVRECFSATIRGRAECPPSPVVFFPQLTLSHPKIHPRKTFISLLSSSPVHSFSSNRIHPEKKTFISLIVFFPSSLFSHPNRIHPEKKNIHLPNCLLPKLALFSASNRIHPEKNPFIS